MGGGYTRDNADTALCSRPNLAHFVVRLVAGRMSRNQDEMISGGIVTPFGFSSLANHFTLLSSRDISRVEEESNLVYVSRRLPAS